MHSVMIAIEYIATNWAEQMLAGFCSDSHIIIALRVVLQILSLYNTLMPILSRFDLSFWKVALYSEQV